MDKLTRTLAVPLLAAGLLAAGCSSSDPDPVIAVSPVAVTKTFAADKANSGSVWQSGQVYHDVAAVGDSTTDQGIRGFLSYSVAAIPAESTIQSAVLDLSTYTKFPAEVDPFAAPNPLGNFRVLCQNYGTMAAGSYAGVTYGTMYDSASNAGLGSVDVRPCLAAAHATSAADFQLRLQFVKVNADGVAQLARFSIEKAKLTVVYQ